MVRVSWTKLWPKVHSLPEGLWISGFDWRCRHEPHASEGCVACVWHGTWEDLWTLSLAEAALSYRGCHAVQP